MTIHVNIHMPANIASINDLSGEKFVAKKSTDGGVKTIDLYYRDSTPKNKREAFLQKINKFFDKLGGFKAATKSSSLGNALSSIRQQNCSTHWHANPNSIITTLKEAADSPNQEIHRNGVTVTVKNWDETHDLTRLANRVMGD